jgi:hypothetical protein
MWRRWTFPSPSSKELVVVILSYSPKPDRMIDFNGVLRDIIAAIQG